MLTLTQVWGVSLVCGNLRWLVSSVCNRDFLIAFRRIFYGSPAARIRLALLDHLKNKTSTIPIDIGEVLDSQQKSIVLIG